MTISDLEANKLWDSFLERWPLEKLAGIQMIDVHLPTTDGREVILTRYTQPEPEQLLLLDKLKLTLPEQPPPKITAKGLAS